MKGYLDMDDVVFRTKREEPKEVGNENIVPEEKTQSIIKEEVPYSDYLAENGKPYLADRFTLGDNWEIFSKELGLLEAYVKSRIKTGEIANSVKAVEKLVKQMEKMNNLKDEERTVVKLGVLASYIEFLNDTDGIKMNAVKYG